MREERIDLKLYGVVSEILPDGQIAVCEPIFKNYLNLKDKKLYRLVTEEVEISTGTKLTYPKQLKEIDVSSFGKPVFLPASIEKIGDGNKYFIYFQSTLNATKGEYRDYCDIPIMRWIDNDFFTRRDCPPINLNVGIKFPDKFVAIRGTEKFILPEQIEGYFR